MTKTYKITNISHLSLIGERWMLEVFEAGCVTVSYYRTEADALVNAKWMAPDGEG